MKDRDSRIDLFISFSSSENLSFGFKTQEIVSETTKRVLSLLNSIGSKPFSLFESSAQLGERADAVMKDRLDGLALFLFPPMLFKQPCCIAELRDSFKFVRTW